MRTAADERGAALFVAAFPVGWQYMPGYLDKDRERVLFPTAPAGDMREAANPLLDLILDLAGGLFEDDQIHLTPAGRARAGRALKTFVANAGILRGRE